MTRTLPALFLLLLTLSGCTYEKIVSQSGLLVGLQGAESQIPAKRRGKAAPDVLRTPDQGIRIENEEDGTVTLYAKSVRQLMIHITTTLDKDEKDLFVQQVLSQRTKDEFHERGLDPGLAFDELKKHERDIGRLFYFMQMGEYTPGLFLQTISRNTFRLKLPRTTHESLYWIGLDVVFEQGNYRLRWFIPNN